MAYGLPDFRPLHVSALRALWRKYPRNRDVQDLILEIMRSRRVLARIERLRVTIDRVWKDDVGSQLVALEELRCLLQDERTRVGILSDRER